MYAYDIVLFTSNTLTGIFPLLNCKLRANIDCTIKQFNYTHLSRTKNDVKIKQLSPGNFPSCSFVRSCSTDQLQAFFLYIYI